MNTVLLRKPQQPARVSAWLAQIPADTLLAEAQALAAELATLKGCGLTVARGCHQAEMIFGAISVLVEFEAEPAEPETRDEPGCSATVSILRVFLNGAWCDADDVVPNATLERWETELLEGAADAREEFKIARAEARREAAMEQAA